MGNSEIKGLWWTFPLLLAVFSVSAWNMVIMDCDETFNYLDPLHNLIYGYGLQTWEYDPRFALRPYSFLLLFSLPLKLMIRIFNLKDKVIVFKMLRMIMGTMSAWGLSHLIDTIAMTIGLDVAKYTAILAATSTGIFISSTSFLPNTFSMFTLSFIWSYWLRGHDTKVIMLTALNFIIGWPYATLAAILPCLVSFKQSYASYAKSDGEKILSSDLTYSVKLHLLLRRLFLGATFSAIYILVPSLMVEYHYYGRLTFPSLNAILYNVLSRRTGTEETGPELFGVEPWNYYLLNLALNFNICLPLSLLGVAISHRTKSVTKTLMLLSNFMLFIIFSAQGHKEERFLFILYPIICFGAALSLSFIRKFHLGKLVAYFTLASTATVSILRILAILKFYSAPQNLLSMWSPDSTTRLCMGSTWYRFPSSFYMANKARLGFVQDDVDGQLPMYYGNTRSVTPMNSLNKAIPEQYTRISKCDYLMEYGERTDDDIFCANIAEVSKTKAPYKWLWIPTLSETNVVLKRFCIYKTSDQHIYQADRMAT